MKEKMKILNQNKIDYHSLILHLLEIIERMQKLIFLTNTIDYNNLILHILEIISMKFRNLNLKLKKD